MKKKIFSIFVAVLLILPCLVLAGCGNKSYEPISRVPYQPDADFWVQYSSAGTNNQSNLYAYAKKTVGDKSYYYVYHNNHGGPNEVVAIVNADQTFTVYRYDYDRVNPENSSWVDATSSIEETTWFDFTTREASGVMSMAIVQMFNTGEINSLIRHEDGTEIQDLGVQSFHLDGIPGYVEAEDIDALHFYDSQSDEHYYFAQDSGVVLRNDYNRDYKAHVFKTEFTLYQVVTANGRLTTGLPTLP